MSAPDVWTTGPITSSWVSIESDECAHEVIVIRFGSATDAWGCVLVLDQGHQTAAQFALPELASAPAVLDDEQLAIAAVNRLHESPGAHARRAAALTSLIDQHLHGWSPVLLGETVAPPAASVATTSAVLRELVLAAGAAVASPRLASWMIDAADDGVRWSLRDDEILRLVDGTAADAGVLAFVRAWSRRINLLEEELRAADGGFLGLEAQSRLHDGRPSEVLVHGSLCPGAAQMDRPAAVRGLDGAHQIQLMLAERSLALRGEDRARRPS